MNPRKKTIIGTGGLTALALFGILALSSFPVTFAGSAYLKTVAAIVPVPTDIAATSACADFWSEFPTNGTLVNYYYSSTPNSFPGSSYGFHLDNFSLSTAMSYWSTQNNGNFQSGLVNGTWQSGYTTNEITTYGIYANVHSLTAANDNLSLANGEFIVSVNGSRDSQATVVGASLSASQYNSTGVAIAFHAKTLDLTLGPVLASTIGEKQYAGLNLQLSDFTATVYTDCQDKVAYAFTGTMTGLGALGAGSSMLGALLQKPGPLLQKPGR